jgi:hypothetical protein
LKKPFSEKKSPDRKFRSGDFPFYPQDLRATLVREGLKPYVQAGLLTLGSSYWPRLPIPPKENSGIAAAFVPDYSDGLVLDLHEVPF